MAKLNPEELTEQEREILAKIVANLEKQPEHRLAILAITDPETGETKMVKSHKIGDSPSKTKVIKE
jgi:hypothetical protein